MSDTKGQLFARLNTSKGTVVVRLFPDEAPETVANFVGLAEGTKQWMDPRTGQPTTAKLYDGTVFHRVIKGFMIQGGDPLGNGRGGPGYKFGDEIDPSLPDAEITVFGPPPTSGTRDAFVELVMIEGCAAFPAIQALEASRKEEVCQRMRTDGPFIEAGENDNLIVQRLQADHNALGIFGYSFLYENQDTLKAVAVEGVKPTPETIADESYTVARPLFFYVKNVHRGVIPGLQEFVEEYVSEEAMGPGGYLEERGLIPLDDQRREEVRKAAIEGKNFTRFTQ